MASVGALRRDLVRAAYFLLQIRERKIHRVLGFDTISAYAAAAAGLNRRQCEDFLTLARRLPHYREVEAALRVGSLSWSQAQLICARTEPRDQEQWLDAARGMSVRQLHASVRKAARSGPDATLPPPPADTPAPNPATSVRTPTAAASGISTPPIPADAIHHVTLRFTGDQYARWQAVSRERHRAGSLVEAVLDGLAGGRSPGQLVHQVVILECPSCRQAVQPTSRGEIAVSRPLLDAAHCDAVIEDAEGNRRHTVPPRLRRLALQRAPYRCQADGCSNASFLQIHHRRPVAGAGNNDLENLAVLCWRCHRAFHEAEESARLALRGTPE